MEKIILKADKRIEIGKGGARSLRRQGMLPAVMYGEGQSTAIKVPGRQVTRLITKGTGEHSLITIQMNNDGGTVSEHPVLIKDYQMDPVTDELLHVDFIEVSLEKDVQVTIPLVMTKVPVGVKMGGILQHLIREIEIECLPTRIPEKIEFSAESIEIGHSMHVSDLPVQEGIKIITDPEEVILTVSAPVVEEAAPAEAAEEEAAEPELVKEKGKAEGEQPKEEKSE